MTITFNEISWNEYLFWQKNDKQKLNKINELLNYKVEHDEILIFKQQRETI